LQPFKNITTKVALAACGTLLFLILIEIILRSFIPIPFSMEVEYLPDGHLGTRLQPDRVYTLKSGRTASVNNMGFRMPTDLEYNKPPNFIRIVALGGSSTFSYNTGDDLIWTAVLERKLKEHYGDFVEVINAGVPGYDIFDSKINYLYQIRPLKPDIVIVYHTWNDMKLFNLLEIGKYPKKSVSSGSSSWLKSFMRNFQFAWRIRNFLNEVVYPRQRENVYGGSSDSKLTIAPNGPAHQWEKQNYDDLAVLLKKDGVLPIFTSQAGLLSYGNLDNPEIRSVIYTEYVKMTFEEILSQWHAISTIIKTSAKENGALFIDVYNKVPHQRTFFRDHVHLTEKGHGRVAEALFNEIISDSQIDSLFRSKITHQAKQSILS